MTAPTGVHHLALRVADLGRAAGFYEAPRHLALLAVFTALACEQFQSPPIVARTETKEAAPVTPPPAPEAKTDPTGAAPQVAGPGAAEPETKAIAAPPAATPPPPTSPGPAFFAVDKRGIVRLDQGRFTPLKNGPDSLIKNLHIAGDALWVLGFETIYKLPRLGDDAFKAVARGGFQDTGSIDDFFVVSDDDLWVAGFGGVSHWDGKAWAREEKAAIGAGDDTIDGIAVDRDGKVWVASSNNIHVKDRGAWSTLDLSKIKDKLFMEGVERAADGTVYALASAALIKLGPGAGEAQAVKLGGVGFPSYSDLALGPDGTIAARNLFDLVIAAPVAGRSKTWRKKDYMSEGVRALAVDGAGRVWVGSEIGVTILGPGDARVEWPSGTVPELSGEVVGVAVAGAGPAELPATGPVKTGGLKGKLLRGGRPVVGVEVELCPSPAMLFSKSPCDDSSVRFSGKTDAQGEWKFDKVPLGAYGLALKTEGKWKIQLGSDLGVEMKEGQMFEVGSISLDK